MNEDIKRLVEALEETTQRLTQAVGIVVEFGDLNGFRNLSDEELGKAVTQMAVAGTDTITRARQALASLTTKETEHGSEGLQPPVVEVDGKVFSSLGASRAPSCVSAGVAETPSDGWVLVPPEPTEQMWIAGLQELPFGPSSPDHAMRCYRAMIAAAPPTDCRTSGARLEQPCQCCGRHNPVWFAPSPVWNLAMGGPDSKDDPGGMLCPVCFIERAEAAGIRPTGWLLSPEPCQTSGG